LPLKPLGQVGVEALLRWLAPDPPLRSYDISARRAAAASLSVLNPGWRTVCLVPS
jgi:hypothetical protein